MNQRHRSFDGLSQLGIYRHICIVFDVWHKKEQALQIGTQG